jgi:hypothetical protein
MAMLSAYRRRRIVWSTILIGTFFLGSFLYFTREDENESILSHGSLPWNRFSKGRMIGSKINNFKAMLYMVTNTDNVIPKDFDTDATPLDLSTFSSNSSWSATTWEAKFKAMDENTPLVIFSKVRGKFPHLAHVSYLTNCYCERPIARMSYHFKAA